MIAVFELSVKMEEAEESMDCSDSEMIPSSPKEEAGPEQEDIPEIGMEQDVAADPGDSKKCKRFESYDDMYGNDR